MAIRAQVVVRGIVQGVGFRPFVYRLAQEHQLSGWVLNSTQGVVIEVEGPRQRIDGFIAGLKADPPPQAVIEKVEANLLPPVGYSSFIVEASREGDEFVLISPDICICADCLNELRGSQDRRWAYPFINCTNCGPRFTIISDIPYDRPKTTMSAFTMCPRCDEEYHNPADRRFHAQPNACPLCGPRLELASNGTRPAEAPLQREPIEGIRRLLAEGAIVAVKGLGGFHLACDATNAAAVATLRERKQRVDKPFAVMSLDVDTVRRYCQVSEGEAQLLESPARPIVLLRRKPGSPIAAEVAPANNNLGVMLPYTPLHYLLLSDGATPAPLALVMTSGNMSEEPIAIGNQEALERLSPLADYFLFHDRDIYVRYDDSVAVVEGGAPQLVRRARGNAPYPVFLPFKSKQILACGAELKNTFCVTKDSHAFLSQHIGDMENEETLEHFENTIEIYKKLFRVEPEIIAADLHPDYLATKYARQVAKGLKLVEVQHHHAHIASCLAENRAEGPVIGVALDGTGYGSDGAIWGGEFLVADYKGFRRAGQLEYVPLVGGEAAIKKPYRMALSYLYTLLGEDFSLEGLPLGELNPAEVAIIKQQLKKGINSPPTSSAGRLFDAVAALVGVRGEIDYEAQAAIELEMLAAEATDESKAYPFVINKEEDIALVRLKELWAALVSDVQDKVPVPEISLKFHNTMAGITANMCRLISQDVGLKQVALSGGVFQNRLLSRLTVTALKKEGFEVLTHKLVPTNDGGISLGQAVVANFVTEGQ